MKWQVFKNVLEDIKQKEIEKEHKSDISLLVVSKDGKISKMTCDKATFLSCAWIVFDNIRNVVRLDVVLNDDRKSHTELIYQYLDSSVMSIINNCPAPTYSQTIRKWNSLPKEKRDILVKFLALQAAECS